MRLLMTRCPQNFDSNQRMVALRLCLLYSIAIVMANPSRADDWPYWRGPESNGQSRETGLIDDWDPRGGSGSNVAWQRDDLGGRSTPIVFENRLYTIVRSNPATSREGEKVVCVDATSGETIWENAFNVYLSDVPDTRVGWSSCVADPDTGKIYALGVCGTFQCLDGKTGETLWKLPLHEQFGLLSTYGGRTNFPVICDDLVIISAIVIGWGDMAKPAHRFLGIDKSDGTIVWFEGTRLLPYDTTYSGPTLTTLAGQKALVFGSGDGAVWALQPRTGQPIWQYRFSRRGLNVAPLVVGDRVFASHSEENIFGTTMGAAVGIDASLSGDITDTGELWRLEELMAGKSSPVAHEGRLYLCDDRGKLHVLDMETGDKIGRRYNLGTIMRSSPLLADGKIYAITQGGRWHILALDEERGVKVINKGKLLKGDESHASPICANGRIYIQTSGRLYCLANDSTIASGTNVNATSFLPAESALTDKTPTHLQVVPCELLLQPGQSQAFEVRLFNKVGQFLGTSEAEFSVDSPLTFAGNTLTIPSETTHTAATVTATAEGLTGRARVRVVPGLPWRFDFEDIAISPNSKTGQPPIPWVGCRYRHVIREVDGNKVMVKITTIPKGTRSRCWFGHPSLSDYTIQADVRGSESNGKMPDIGLIAQGYTLDLQGANQNLQIRSWVPQLRMASTVAYPWKPNTWYTLKFSAENHGDKVNLKGKIWEKGLAEPSAWTVLAEDSSPNRTGSPGLFGNAKDAELLIDNITVRAN